MHSDALQDILILLAAAVVLVALFRRVRVPAILAYLLTGAALGPYGLGLIPDADNTRFLAEFGVVFLLFTVGLEFSLPHLIAMRREVLGLGGAQVVITTLLVTVAAHGLGLNWAGAFVVGGAVTMSSTAIVIKQLAEQLELNSRHGRLTVGVLLFQDLAVVPFLVVITTLSGEANNSVFMELLWALAKGFMASGAMLAVGHWLLRPLFREVASAHSAELFTLTVLLFSLAAAWLTHLSGLSLALGAFLAGMMLGETEFRHQVEADIRPFRDVLLGLFFITIGMLLNVHAVTSHALWIAALVAAIILLKICVSTLLCIGFRVERGIAFRAGLALAQGGEFGLALLALAAKGLLIDNDAFQITLAALVISMGISPILIRHNGWLAKHIFSRSYGGSRLRIEDDINAGATELNGHVIIAGFGRIGQNIARFLEQEKFPYIALDLDPIRVQEARAAGAKVFYGDATHREILDAAGLQRARAIVISLDDPFAAIKMLPQIRGLRPDIPVLVRTRDDAHLERLQQLGATEVVPETFETSLTLVEHLLFLLHIPIARIQSRLQDARQHRYQILREFFPGQHGVDLESPDATREALHAVTLPDGAYAIGKTPRELELENLDIVLTAIRRGEAKDTRPRPDLMLQPADVLVMYGARENLERAEAMLLTG